MDDWVTRALDSLGYFGIALFTLLETVFPPIPSELVLPLAGYRVSTDALTLAGAVLAGTVGATAGALLLYWLGRWYGEERLKGFARRHGRWLTLSPHDVDRVSAWFDRHGIWAVFVCRMIPGLRSLISIPAGIHRMGLARFLVATIAGTVLWTGLLVYLGQMLGDNFDQVGRYLGPATQVIVGVMVVVYIVRVVRHRGDPA